MTRKGLFVAAAALLLTACSKPGIGERVSGPELAEEVVGAYDTRQRALEECREALAGEDVSACDEAVAAEFGGSSPGAKSETDQPAIEGLQAVDVTLNLEERYGWECDGPQEGKSLIRYDCKSPTDPTSYVEIFGRDLDEIVNVAAFSNSFPEDLLAYVATIPYADSEPARAKKWVLQNLDQSEAKMRIGSANFNLFKGELLEIDAVGWKFAH